MLNPDVSRRDFLKTSAAIVGLPEPSLAKIAPMLSQPWTIAPLAEIQPSASLVRLLCALDTQQPTQVHKYLEQAAQMMAGVMRAGELTPDQIASHKKDIVGTLRRMGQEMAPHMQHAQRNYNAFEAMMHKALGDAPQEGDIGILRHIMQAAKALDEKMEESAGEIIQSAYKRGLLEPTGLAQKSTLPKLLQLITIFWQERRGIDDDIDDDEDNIRGDYKPVSARNYDETGYCSDDSAPKVLTDDMYTLLMDRNYEARKRMASQLMGKTQLSKPLHDALEKTLNHLCGAYGSPDGPREILTTKDALSWFQPHSTGVCSIEAHAWLRTDPAPYLEDELRLSILRKVKKFEYSHRHIIRMFGEDWLQSCQDIINAGIRNVTAWQEKQPSLPKTAVLAEHYDDERMYKWQAMEKDPQLKRHAWSLRAERDDRQRVR